MWILFNLIIIGILHPDVIPLLILTVLFIWIDGDKKLGK